MTRLPSFRIVLSSLALGVWLWPLTAGCSAPTESALNLEAQGAVATHEFRLVYSTEVRQVPAETDRLRLWIPVPTDTLEQRVRNLSARVVVDGATDVRLKLDLDDDSEFADEVSGLRVFHRAIENGSGRSLCVETPGRPFRIELAFDVERHETQGGGTATEEELARRLRPEGLVPLDGKVAVMSASLSTDPDPMVAGRQLYDHTLERMRYAKPLGEGWGRGDAEWACDSRFGNCTDFHSYFMGLARSKGIPARFEMGFPVPSGEEPEASIAGYHCWAFFWADGAGWVPVDISEADKHPEKADYYFGTLDPHRVTMTGGRDLVLDPPPTAGPRNFFIYPHLEIDDQPSEAFERSFRRINL